LSASLVLALKKVKSDRRIVSVNSGRHSFFKTSNQIGASDSIASRLELGGWSTSLSAVAAGDTVIEVER